MADKARKPVASKGYVEKPSTVAAEPLIMEEIPEELAPYLEPGGMDTAQKTIDARAVVVRLAMTGRINPKWIKIFNELGRDAAMAHAARKSNQVMDAMAGFAALSRLAMQAQERPPEIEQKERVVLAPLDEPPKEPVAKQDEDPFSESEYEEPEIGETSTRRFAVDLQNVEPVVKAPPPTYSLRDILRRGSE